MSSGTRQVRETEELTASPGCTTESLPIQAKTTPPTPQGANREARSVASRKPQSAAADLSKSPPREPAGAGGVGRKFAGDLTCSINYRRLQSPPSPHCPSLRSVIPVPSEASGDPARLPLTRTPTIPATGQGGARASAFPPRTGPAAKPSVLWGRGFICAEELSRSALEERCEWGTPLQASLTLICLRTGEGPDSRTQAHSDKSRHRRWVPAASGPTGQGLLCPAALRRTGAPLPPRSPRALGLGLVQFGCCPQPTARCTLARGKPQRPNEITRRTPGSCMVALRGVNKNSSSGELLFREPARGASQAPRGVASPGGRSSGRGRGIRRAARAGGTARTHLAAARARGRAPRSRRGPAAWRSTPTRPATARPECGPRPASSSCCPPPPPPAAAPSREQPGPPLLLLLLPGRRAPELCASSRRAAARPS